MDKVVFVPKNKLFMMLRSKIGMIKIVLSINLKRYHLMSYIDRTITAKLLLIFALKAQAIKSLCHYLIKQIVWQ